MPSLVGEAEDRADGSTEPTQSLVQKGRAP
jgi:hypothetical protein